MNLSLPLTIASPLAVSLPPSAALHTQDDEELNASTRVARHQMSVMKVSARRLVSLPQFERTP